MVGITRCLSRLLKVAMELFYNFSFKRDTFPGFRLGTKSSEGLFVDLVTMTPWYGKQTFRTPCIARYRLHKYPYKYLNTFNKVGNKKKSFKAGVFLRPPAPPSAGNNALYRSRVRNNRLY